ncbi:MAG: glycosyltransferase, partial [bacterium]
MTEITPNNTVFVIFSFEGPDPYSQAGGLGTRVHNLAEALAEQGFETHLFFIGAPELPGEERRAGGRYVLHRWCQWISRYHPNGVYDGEEGKVKDYAASVPAYVRNEIILNAANRNKLTVVMAEEWQTADALIALSDQLYADGHRSRTLMLWNANNIISFHRINWGRLSYVAIITAVSKFMKHLLWQMGVNPVVVPNGIPARMLEPLDKKQAKSLKDALQKHGKELLLLKIGRFDPAKRWRMAVEAVAGLKKAGIAPLFIIRGGIEPHGNEILALAGSLGLTVEDVYLNGGGVDDCIAALRDAPRADILHLKFFLPELFVRLLYRVCDSVFANSGFEPFGLVGLEVMASGGIAFTGATGEDYVVPFVNAVSVETDDYNEILSYLLYLHRHPELREKIKREAHKTASSYSWDRVVHNLLRRIE